MTPSSASQHTSGVDNHASSQHTSGVDYHATSQRIAYADLSASVREAADTALGSPVVRAAPPVTSGFTNAYAGGVLLRDGRRAFLKADQCDLIPRPLAALAPGQVVDDLLEDRRLRDAVTDGVRLPSSPELLPSWLPARIDEVVTLAADHDALRMGNHLIHFDLRPDNLLIGRGESEATDRAYVLDWNWVTLGPAWCDWVGLIPTMHAQGFDLAELLSSTPLSRAADPHAVDVWLALLAVYMLVCCEDKPPPGATMALRQHQRFYAKVYLDSLATHRGWL
jgi:hypothetical protein